MKYFIDNKVVKININTLIPVLCLFGCFLYLLKIPMTASFVSILFISTYIYLYSSYNLFREITKLKPLLLWLLLTIYHLVNAKLQKVEVINIADFLHGFKIYASICIFTFFLCVDYLKTLKYLIICFLIYIYINLLLCGFVMRGEERSEEGIISAVLFGKSGYMIAIFMVYYSVLKNYSFLKLLTYLLIPISITLYAQTRTAFAIILIHIIGFYYSIVLKTKLTLKNIIAGFSLILLCYIGVVFMIENSKLGERFTSDNFSKHYEKSGIATGTIFDTIAGERLSYYVIGWRLFLKEPITGIGLDEYQHATGGDYPMHVEYMKHLTEGGIIGAFIFILFLITLAIEIHKANVDKKIRWLIIFTYAANLFSLIYSSSYKQEFSVIIYSIIISVTLNKSALIKKYN